VQLPGIDGPVRGFTFPRGDVFYVITTAGLIRVGLNPVEARTVADPATLAALYDPRVEKLPWDGQKHLVYDADGGDITAKQCIRPCQRRQFVIMTGATGSGKSTSLAMISIS